ncbi:UNVERIFIED_CONTAM: heptaprenyl diphosphate synthase [Acetivibrio alkalicellulosi]
MNRTKKTVVISLLISQALILSIIESWIPVLVPGVKLGLANIITLIVIVFFGYKEALTVVIIKSLLISMLGGRGIETFLFSVTGGILSALVMAGLYNVKKDLFSIIGISVTGAVVHNLGQVFIASIVIRDIAIFTLLPVILTMGCAMGFIVGLAASFLEKTFRKINIFGL